MIKFKLINKKDILHVKEQSFDIDFPSYEHFIDYIYDKNNNYFNYKDSIEKNSWGGTHQFINGNDNGIHWVGYETVDVIDMNVTHNLWKEYFTDKNLYLTYKSPSQGLIDMMNGGYEEIMKKRHVDYEPVFKPDGYISLNIPTQFLIDLKSYLETMENYLRGEHSHEIDEIQLKEDLELMNESKRLQEILKNQIK
jgi:hypothetical protein